MAALLGVATVDSALIANPLPIIQTGACPNPSEYPQYKLTTSAVTTATYKLLGYTKDLDNIYNMFKSMVPINPNCVSYDFESTSTGIKYRACISGTCTSYYTTDCSSSNVCYLKYDTFSLPLTLAYNGKNDGTKILVWMYCVESISDILDPLSKLIPGFAIPDGIKTFIDTMSGLIAAGNMSILLVFADSKTNLDSAWSGTFSNGISKIPNKTQDFSINYIFNWFVGLFLGNTHSKDELARLSGTC